MPEVKIIRLWHKNSAGPLFFVSTEISILCSRKKNVGFRGSPWHAMLPTYLFQYPPMRSLLLLFVQSSLKIFSATLTAFDRQFRVQFCWWAMVLCRSYIFIISVHLLHGSVSSQRSMKEERASVMEHDAGELSFEFEIPHTFQIKHMIFCVVSLPVLPLLRGVSHIQSMVTLTRAFPKWIKTSRTGTYSLYIISQ